MKTLVIGASEKEDRYSNKAVRMLRNHGHQVVAIGLRPGLIVDVPIETGMPRHAGIDTVTLYVGPQRQDDLVPYVLGLRPRRVIFNPGTENPAFQESLRAAGIEPVEGCTLVMLSTDQY